MRARPVERGAGDPRPGRRETAAWTLLGLAAALGMLWGWNWQVGSSDWSTEAAAPLAALLHGHLGTFFSTAPAYGPSLLLRAPFALPGSLAHGGQLLAYRLSAIPCSLALAGLGIWLAVRLRRNGAGPLSAGATVLLCAANPIAFKALVIGHPEELLGAVLCAAAVLLAMRGRDGWASLALGVAIANKQWALLAIGPVLVALPAHRWRTLIIAGAIAAGLEAPMLIASTTVKTGTSRLIVNDTGVTFYPWQLFWFFGPRGHWTVAMAHYIPRGYRMPPGWIAGRAHLLIVWLALPLSGLAAWRRMPRERALLLLALLMLMRCLLDPWDNAYYPLPFIVALAAWEGRVAGRFPLGAAAATGAAWLIFDFLPHQIGVDLQAVSFLVPALAVFAVLAAAVYRPALAPARRRQAAVSRPRAVPS